jgi:hypothetical protein
MHLAGGYFPALLGLLSLEQISPQIGPNQGNLDLNQTIIARFDHIAVCIVEERPTCIAIDHGQFQAKSRMVLYDTRIEIRLLTLQITGSFCIHVHTVEE